MVQKSHGIPVRIFSPKIRTVHDALAKRYACHRISVVFVRVFLSFNALGFPSGSTMPLGWPQIRGSRVRPSPTRIGFCPEFCNVRNIITFVRSSTSTPSNCAYLHQALPVRVLPTDTVVSLDARRTPREKTLHSEIDSCISRPPHSPMTRWGPLLRGP